jgi:predicted alpha/beta-hydrolase family hydrolase
MQALVPTPAGEARITRFAAAADRPRRALVVLGHGAGGGIQAPDLQALASALPARGVEVVLVEQPWRVAGKKIAAPPKTSDAGWEPVIEYLRKEAAEAGARTSGHGTESRQVPLIVGGRSAGARVACRTGLATGAAAVLALAFPLHPPGKPEKSRAGELLGTGLPTLVVQGATDPFGTAAQFPPLPAAHRLVALRAGNHEFAVRKTQEPVLGALTEAVAAWIDDLVDA